MSLTIASLEIVDVRGGTSKDFQFMLMRRSSSSVTMLAFVCRDASEKLPLFCLKGK